jgi:hypothetical protein
MELQRMKTKQRGLHRKCQDMVRRISEQTEVFPKPHQESDYWHLHLPVAYGLLDSTSTPFGVRRLCVQTLVARAKYLASIAPAGEVSTRVVVAINLPELWSSQIIVFFGSKYFDAFFNRNTEAQRWTKLPQNRSLVREWSIIPPEGFSEHGFLEEIDEEGYNHKGELWFIGQLTAG